jgi:sialidase-1
MGVVRLNIWMSILSLLPFLATGQGTLYRTTVWEANENNIFTHFVYGLTVTVKGTILAFSEARIVNGSDHGAHHIVLKRSVDGGKSFSESVILAESSAGQSWANPTAVQDTKTKVVFLFYALNHDNRSSEIFYIKSSDDGLTWTRPADITGLFKINSNGWTFHLPGPGHGIQLTDGRLIVPVWHRKDISFPAAKRNYGVNCIYSDDHGRTWKSGGDTPVGELNESQIVEQTNGDILLIGRTISSNAGSCQAKVISKDQGISWSAEIEYDLGLPGAVCDIGLLRYSLDPGILLVSQPADLKKRRDLTVRVSNDEGKNWTSAKLLGEGPATYSDLAILPDKTIVCLYGSGSKGNMPENVVLACFNFKWLKENNINIKK